MTLGEWGGNVPRRSPRDTLEFRGCFKPLQKRQKSDCVLHRLWWNGSGIDALIRVFCARTLSFIETRHVFKIARTRALEEVSHPFQIVSSA